MSSIIEGYNYDIFISYRQKDNKGDRWVSEFVEALKTELESTFKEEISVYFDINPHNGLLETHDVDASLKDKLKCLVFIPIISRTYCDPKSFAWEHEFKAFVEQASQDQFGLKVKLPNGNVASRVLPIRIHDLDTADIKEFESVLSGVLRGVEFIYKSAGVNRPLRSKEENPQDNLNHTLYRDQINKVANAIKEVISALGLHEQKAEEVSKDVSKPVSITKKSNKIKIIIASIIALVLLIVVFFLIPKLFKPTEKLEKSIAVLPFKNDSPEASEGNTPFINGLMEEILINLQTIKEFRVLGRTSVEQFRNNTTKSISAIAKELGVNYIVEGSVQKYGNMFRLRVQLIRAEGKEAHVWAKSYEQEIKETKDIFNIQSQIAQAIATELKATITPEEKGIIGKTPTTNLTAYDFYQRGKDELAKYPWPDKLTPEAFRIAVTLFHKALDYDSTFAQAYTGLAKALMIMSDISRTSNNLDNNSINNNLDSMLILADIALSYNDKLADAYLIRGVYYSSKGNSNKAMDEFERAIKYNPNDCLAYAFQSLEYGAFDLVKELEYAQKATSLDHGPELPVRLEGIGNLYYNVGFPDKGNDCYLEALKLTGDSVKYLDNVIPSIIYTQGEYKKGIEYNKKKYLRDSSDAQVLWNLGEYYLRLGEYKESLKYYKKYISALKSKGQPNPPTDPFIGFAYLQNGFEKEAEYYLDGQIDSLKTSLKKSLYPWYRTFVIYNLAEIYACMGDKGKAYEYLKMLKQTPLFEVMNLSRLTYIKNDPLFNSIRQEPEFQGILKDMESKYQAEHERVRKWMEEQGKL
jgi:TolB-like protein